MSRGRVIDRRRRRDRLERTITRDQAGQIPTGPASQGAKETDAVHAENCGVSANAFEPDHPFFGLASRCSVGFHVRCAPLLTHRQKRVNTFFIPSAIPLRRMKKNRTPPAELAGIVKQNLRAIRGTLSQAAFARLIGIANQVTYFRYENGRLPKPAVLQEAARRLGMDVSELLATIPAKRAIELQEHALMLCFEPEAHPGQKASAAMRDDFSTPDFQRALFRSPDADLEEALNFFLKASIRQSGIVIDLCQQVVKTIRLEQSRRAAVGKTAPDRADPSE